MKKIVFLFIYIITAFTFASCSEDSSTQATAKYVTINLQIGADTTLTLSGGSTSSAYNSSVKKFESGKTLLSTRATVDGVNVPDFVPEVPNTFTAYILASKYLQDPSNWQALANKDDVIDTVTVHTGSNFVTIPNTYKGKNINFSASDLKIYVTNYSNGTEMNNNAWYNWSGALAQLPAGSTTLYLYGKNDTLKEERSEEYGDIMTGEVKMINPYAAVCVYKNNYVTGNPSDWSGTTALSGDWYYLYKNCFWGNAPGQISLGLNIPITYINNSGNAVKGSSWIYDTISANYIYQYIIDNH
ncbi:MAG: hypothetical protein LKH27_06215 [Prevotella sp.]|jgi:hypothetical protein|nr:hypothetical protein [Prevotella sp.]MCH3992560.1 hypothetical protein [Prevotella sp.]MCI1291448.1 hypothetical protein [Prevotella sp.]MCI1473986.1 hypothetical protein [Prevotella sp.]MCI1549371.1 hypothetical protein [Prevotella sp.]MCI1595874.1 hypothetical protein [Prevotella sp.]